MWHKILSKRGGTDCPPPPSNRKTHDMNKKVTAANLSAASFTASEAGAFLPLAAQAAIKGKAEIDSAKAKGAAALAVMVAGFASDEVAGRAWTFDIIGKAEGDVHHHVQCEGFAQFGDTSAPWCRNGEGAVSKVAQGAYKAAFQAEFFNLPAPNAAVWTMASKAVAMARAIREEGMTASLEGGKLKLEGGAGDKADTMRAAAAKSLSALASATKEVAGTNREGHGNAKGDGETRAATPSEICAAAALLARRAAKGDEALCSAALSSLRAIAALVAANPDAFAED